MHFFYRYKLDLDYLKENHALNIEVNDFELIWYKIILNIET